MELLRNINSLSCGARGEEAGRCPGPRKGTCPLDPVANAAVESVQIPAAQILAPQKWLAILWVRILAPEAQSEHC